MDNDSLSEIIMRINNLKDMLLSDVDMPEDVARHYLNKLGELEAERLKLTGRG